MLVLSRKRSEMIQIGDNVIVKVIRTGRSTVKIGIQAPDHVRVLRAELCEDDPLAPKPSGAHAESHADEEEDAEYDLVCCSDQFPVV